MTIRSVTENPGKFRQVVHIDAHTLHADLKQAVGGEDSAPGPHDLFDASLATCKALTVAVYAKSRKMALEGVSVEVTRDDSEERKGTYKLAVKLAFQGALSAEDKAKLHDISQRCPIHKLMTSSTVEITTLPLEGQAEPAKEEAEGEPAAQPAQPPSEPASPAASEPASSSDSSTGAKSTG